MPAEEEFLHAPYANSARPSPLSSKVDDSIPLLQQRHQRMDKKDALEAEQRALGHRQGPHRVGNLHARREGILHEHAEYAETMNEHSTRTSDGRPCSVVQVR